jgi:hypothetical protein
VICDAATPDACPPFNGGEACVNDKTDPQFCGSCTKQCTGGHVCQNGACVAACPPGLTSCSSKCVNVTSDGENCDTCGNACPSTLSGNSYCQSGACTTACAPGFIACAVGTLGGAPYTCANLQKDWANCGGCGKACAANQVCDAGACVPYLPASACWECGDGNSMPLCCSLDGQTICTNAAVCP